MGYTEVASAGKETAADDGIVEVVVVYVEAIVSDLVVLVSLGGGVFDGCVVTIIDEVV